MTTTTTVRHFYETLFAAWGQQHWWPADSAFEVILGAYLTQNTAWTNVDKAMANLRAANAMSLDAIRDLPLEKLEQLIRPAGYFRQKAARLKTFIGFLDAHYAGSLERMFAEPTPKLRTELLALNGVGPETADSILLYAGHHDVFVVDAYTRRIFERHALITAKTTYEEIRELVERALAPRTDSASNPKIRQPGNSKISIPPAHAPSKMSLAPRSALAQRFNEFHGLIVQVGKHHCLSRVAKCEECPLRKYL